MVAAWRLYCIQSLCLSSLESIVDGHQIPFFVIYVVYVVYVETIAVNSYRMR